MKKIISLFARNYDGDRMVRNEIVSGAEWVIAGEGVATRKFDGTACMVMSGKLYKRYDVKGNRKPPPGFEPAQDPDPVTGHWPGWVPVSEGQEDRWHREAWAGQADGTYELCGPKVQGNPEGFQRHVLVRHGSVRIEPCPRDFLGIRDYLSTAHIEGIVWHHDDPALAEIVDGRMVKIKTRDFA